MVQALRLALMDIPISYAAGHEEQQGNHWSHPSAPPTKRRPQAERKATKQVRKRRRVRGKQRGLSVCCCIARGHSIDPDRTGDVFEVPLAQIAELNPDLALDLIVGRRRDADAARFCDALKPRRNIYAIPKNVMRLNNHVADIDAHTESNAPVF